MAAKNEKVTSKQKQAEELGPGYYLTQDEVLNLVEVAKEHSRYGERDAFMILFAFNHALRLADLCALSWDQIDLDKGLLQVKVSKTNRHVVHPLTDFERTMLEQLKDKNERPPAVFVTERGGPMTPSNFRKMLTRVGELSSIDVSISPHRLRHARATQLVRAGADVRLVKEFLGISGTQTVIQYYLPQENSNFEKYINALNENLGITFDEMAETSGILDSTEPNQGVDALGEILSATILEKFYFQN